MAKINIERRRNVWPWIIALIVILLLAWGAYALMDRGGPGYLDRPAATSSAPTTAPAIDPAASTTGDAARATPPADDTTPPPQQ